MSINMTTPIKVVTVDGVSVPIYQPSMPDVKTESDVTVNGATVTIPSGHYQSEVTKSVASGTAGTPSATKGTVSNHSISITPKVTNTTGYITGSTKTGTAVTVSASQLVSGTLNITENGEKTVTNYEKVNVNVPVIDTSKATVTASDLANGVIAIDKNGSEVTGNVDTIANGSTKAYSGATCQTTSTGIKLNVTNSAQALLRVGAKVSISATNSVVATAVGLSAGKIVSGNTILGVAGSAKQATQVYYTGSSTPSSSLGSNGDLYLKMG